MLFKTELNAARASVLKHLGYPEGAAVSTRVQDQLSNYLKAAIAEFRAVVYFDAFAITPAHDGPSLQVAGTDLGFSSEFACEALKDCSAMLVCVATIERKPPILESAQLQASGQFFLEAIKNAALERLIEDFWHYIALQSRQAEQTGLTRLYLPGENAWPISDQRTLFSLLRDKEPGLSVKLNDQFMMDPEQSLSFVIGKTKDGSFSEVHHDCSLCTLTSCAFRRQPSELLRLVVHDLSGSHEYYVESGRNLMNAVIEQGYKVDSACGGNKTCGKCRTKIDVGKGPKPGAEEEALRQKQNLSEDERLLCFITVDRDMEITLTQQHLKPQIMVEGHQAESSEGEPWVLETVVEVRPSEIKDQRGFLAALMSAVPTAECMSLNALTKAASLLSDKDLKLGLVGLLWT